MQQEQTFIFRRDSTKATKLSKAEIIADLRAYAEHRHKRSFTTREYDKWKKRRITSGSITKIFGTWTKAMQEAGLRPTRAWKRDVRDLVNAFKACWIEQKSEPTRQRLCAYLQRVNSPFTVKSFEHYFGSLGRLAQRIEMHQNEQISEEQLLERHNSSTSRKPLPPGLRYEILKRDNHQCVLCGASPRIDKSVVLEVDHKLPSFKGGSDLPENLRTLCQACNQGKKDKIE